MRSVSKHFNGYLTFIALLLLTLLSFYLKISEFGVRSFWGLNWELHPEKAPLYRLVALLFLFSVMAYWASRWNPGELLKISWWLPKYSGASIENQCWRDVISVILLTSDDDPISRSSDHKYSRPALIGCLKYIIFMVFSGCVFGIVLDYITFPRVPGLLLAPQNIADKSAVTAENISTIIQISNNLTAYLAIITALIAIYVAKFSIRAQVRAKSRQEWIDQVRTLTAEIFSDISTIFSDKDGVFQKDVAKMADVRRRQMQLELLLNPSEKDHRLLMMLIRRCISPDLVVKPDEFIRAKINPAETEVNSAIEKINSQIKDNNKKINDTEYLRFHRIFAINPSYDSPQRITGTEDQLDAISYIVRLTNIILKREWIRVRDTN